MSNVDHTTENLDPISTVDAYDYLKITRNSDGTITRYVDVPETPATPDPTSPSKTLSKDIPVNPAHNTYIRIFVPSSPTRPDYKRPLIVYFHGGGFIILSAASTPHHDFCSDMAAALDAVVVSVEYRLAPEHRLPTAYEDAVEALHFMRSSDDVWLTDRADLSNCFLMGTSAGGNMAYHVGLHAAAEVDRDGERAFSPMKIRGLILHHAFFGGVRRTASEVRLFNNPMLPLSGSDVMWELALPVGADRDHKYSNPMAGIDDSDVIGRVGLRVLVMGCSGDPLIDRQVELAEMLKKKGIDVEGVFMEGFYHVFDLLELHKAKPTFDLLLNFITRS